MKAIQILDGEAQAAYFENIEMRSRCKNRRNTAHHETLSQMLKEVIQSEERKKLLAQQGTAKPGVCTHCGERFDSRGSSLFFTLQIM